MTLGGIKDFLPFLEFLRDRKIWFRIESLRHDAVTVEIHLVGLRLEVEFFDDHIEYSFFTGDEGVKMTKRSCSTCSPSSANKWRRSTA